MFNEMDFYQLSLLDLEFLGVSMLCCTRIVSRTGAFDVLQSSPSLTILPQYQDQRHTGGSDECVDRETPSNTDAISYSLQSADSSSAQCAPNQIVARLHCCTSSRIEICQEDAANREDCYLGTSSNELHHQRRGDRGFCLQSPVISRRCDCAQYKEREH